MVGHNFVNVHVQLKLNSEFVPARLLLSANFYKDNLVYGNQFIFFYLLNVVSCNVFDSNYKSSQYFCNELVWY